MTDFLELASRRQSCRDFSERSVEREKLVKCAEAARLAPSACNSQPWRIIAVDTPEIVAQVAKCVQQLGINDYFEKAKAFFVVLEEPAKLMPKLAVLIDGQTFAKGDLGGATLSLCLEAESQGLGTCVIGLYDRPKLRELLNVPAATNFFALVAVGYPASDHVRNKQRKPLDQILSFA
jgi:nitroreductase